MHYLILLGLMRLTQYTDAVINPPVNRVPEYGRTCSKIGSLVLLFFFNPESQFATDESISA